MQIGRPIQTDLYWTYCSCGDTVHSRCRSNGRHSAGRARVVDDAAGRGSSGRDSPSRGVLPPRHPLPTTSGGGGGGAVIVAVAVDWVIEVR